MEQNGILMHCWLECKGSIICFASTYEAEHNPVLSNSTPRDVPKINAYLGSP